jgi:hypothetical protein
VTGMNTLFNFFRVLKEDELLFSFERVEKLIIA